MALIIIEGPDGSGKSTLTGRLKEMMPGAEVLHRGPPQDHPLVEYEEPLLDYRPGAGRDVICDRWHWGEWVYPEVLGRESQRDDPTWWHIELFLAARGAVMVNLRPTLHVLRQRLRERGDDLVSEDMLEDIRERYRRLLARSLLPVSHDKISSIMHVARYIERETSRIKHRGSYIGALMPKTLLIGERRNYDEPYPPAFGPYPATSGHYLLTHLTSLSLLGSIGLANAYEEDLYGLWESLMKPRVVALGNRAHVELVNVDVPHGAVPHPQYVRRFIHHHGGWYADLIDQAVYNQEDLRKCRP